MTIKDIRYSYIASNTKLVVVSVYQTEKDFENNIGDIIQVYLEDEFSEATIDLTEKSIFWDGLKDEIVHTAYYGCEEGAEYDE